MTHQHYMQPRPEDISHEYCDSFCARTLYNTSTLTVVAVTTIERGFPFVLPTPWELAFSNELSTWLLPLPAGPVKNVCIFC